MRIKKIKIRDFRSYSGRHSIDISDFTAIVGRNDIGKSTILEAFEIFFNNKVVKVDSGDLCKSAIGVTTIFEIAVVFEDFPDDIIIDANAHTSLSDELLLNAEGDLELVKRYKCGSSVKVDIFCRAQHPNHELVEDLLQKKLSELKKIADDNGIDTSGADRRSSVSLREAIRASIPDLDIRETLVPLNVEDAKKIAGKIDFLLPKFALFQADRPSKDDDPEVVDPMKIAVANALSEVEAELNAIKEKVQSHALLVANATVEKLREMAPNLADGILPSFKAEPRWEGFKLSLTGPDDIPINKRGSGFRRLLLLNFFRAEAERTRVNEQKKSVFYAIEEPEVSQHPDHQVMLLDALLELSENEDTQVLITSHVPALISRVPKDSVRLITRIDNNVPAVQAGGDDVYQKVTDSVGIVPDNRATLALFVEGPHDIAFLERASDILRIHHPELLDLKNDPRIVPILAGGSTLQHWIDQRYLKRAKLCEIHIYDRDSKDSPKYQESIDAVNDRKNDSSHSNDFGCLTNKRELENYIHPDAIFEEFGICITFDHWSDVPALVAQAVQDSRAGQKRWHELSPKGKKRRESTVKKKLNSSVVARMTYEQFQETDADGEILGWLRLILERVV